MGRARSLIEVAYRGHTEEHKAKLSEIHRARWGAPEGMATVRGVHVPFEHRDVLAYFANRLAGKSGAEKAAQYVEAIKADDYRHIPKLKAMFHEAQTINQNRKTIQKLQNEVNRGN